MAWLMDGAARQDAAAGVAKAVAPDAHVAGLRWHADRWWWSDPEGAALYLWAPGRDAGAPIAATAPLRSRMPDSVTAFAFCRSGRVLLAQAKWLCFADLAAPPLEGLGRRPPHPAVAVDPAEPRTAISDGSTDRAGNFVFGTAASNAQGGIAIGSFYQYSLQHGLRRLALPTVSAAHGICFSPDGRTMYFNDAASRRIQQCDYDAAAARVANVRPFAELADGQPRGAVVDSAGCVWSAQTGGNGTSGSGISGGSSGSAGRLVQYAPDGSALRSAPAPHPVRPAFGGPELKQLLVGATGGMHLMDGGGACGLPDALFDDRRT
jgi:L-arabinonolactonase